ncbi:TIGR01212 family radical SAM protein [Hallella faecis]|uniref:TIGR01212 family radical SAM protein n=1 Tax=Hallella faecis TaxID=2841596 RepID=A0ABV1FQ94_9BACT|nr:TIGR01212 family radical SAM protein [Hallella faecis]MBU0289774.1 TIGR01212 family radical SAM protein [Hallella faecis]
MFYKDYSHWIREQFPFRVQKISVDAAFSCPNRDGRLSLGGCTFCDNKTFNPSYCDRGKSITQQLEEGKAFFAKKYPEMKYLAYFQAYSNTYAPLEELKRKYEEALAVDNVVGLVIGTRPDCVSDEALDYLQQLNQRTFLIVEYGIESANDNTLRRINRGHTFDCSRQAIIKAHQRGIITCGHIILGLPGEDEEEMLHQASTISQLPLDILKLHQLQIIKGTPLAKEYEAHPFHVFSAEEYVNLVIRYVSQLRNDLVLERFVSQSPPNMVIAPKWGLKNHEFTDLLNKRIRELGYDHR